MYSAEARDLLRPPQAQKTQDAELRERQGTRDVFVQRGRFKTIVADPADPDQVNVRVDEEIFIPPLLLGSSFSGTLRDAFFTGMESCGLCINRLSTMLGPVVFILAVDGCFSNGLLVDWLHTVAPSDVIVLEDLCSFHNSNRIVIDHVNKGKFDINS